jgi:hypothetical protein
VPLNGKPAKKKYDPMAFAADDEELTPDVANDDVEVSLNIFFLQMHLDLRNIFASLPRF